MINSQDLKIGDIITINFNPVLGYGQRKLRPAMVVTSNKFNRYTRLVGICVISSKDNDFPMNVPLPDGLKVHGNVFSYQLRVVDANYRGFDYIDHAPEITVKKIKAILKTAFKF